MKTFEFKGTLRKKGSTQKFTKKVEADSEEKAKEKLYSLFGGLYKCPKRFIKIEK